MGKASRAKLAAVPPPDEANKPPIALPTMIDPSELAYQTSLIARIQAEQQAQQASLRYWSEFLSKKYSLGAQDIITVDGHIQRKDDGDKKEAL